MMQRRRFEIVTYCEEDEPDLAPGQATSDLDGALQDESQHVGDKRCKTESVLYLIQCTCFVAKDKTMQPQ